MQDTSTMIQIGSDALQIDQASRDEAAQLMKWAADEGWNPGLGDLDAAWEADPQAFIALRHNGLMVGGGSIFSHAGITGYMGLFIVEASSRSKGWGTELWHYRLARLQRRLKPGAPISMAGVHTMAPFYAKGGFIRQHEDVRYQGQVKGRNSPEAVDLADISFQALLDFDQACTLAPRTKFLRPWIARGRGVALLRSGQMVAYGLVRQAVQGYKVGPAFAVDHDAGIALLDHLFSLVEGHVVQVDIPSANVVAQKFLESRGLQAVFSCVHMVHPNGAAVAAELPVQRIFGITSLEFG
jgi:GNAT superfamily N-acetyltransferase